MKKRLIILIVMILSLCTLLVGCGKKDEKAQAIEQTQVSVNVENAKKQNVNLQTSISGKVNPIEEANVSPKMPGKIATMDLTVGQRVSKGQVLFTMDQTDIVNAINSAQAAYDVAVANVATIQEQMNNAKVNYDRMKDLYDQGAISKQQLEQYELSASDSKLAAANAQVNQASVAVENAKRSLADATVVSPISGVVVAVNGHQGEMASSAAPVVSIVNMDKVKVQVGLSEYLINKVKKGDIVNVSIDSAEKKDFQGKITTVSPAAVGNSMTYPVEIEVDNSDNIIKPGMFANISIVTDTKSNVITVPSESAVVKEGETVIFTVKDGKAHVNKVTLGMDNGKLVEVTSGIKEGDVVVTKGQNYLEEASKVKIEAQKPSNETENKETENKNQEAN